MATLEKPRASVGVVDNGDFTLLQPKILPPLTVETIELDDLVTVPDVVW